MGYLEVVPRIPRLLRLIGRTAAAARARRPDAVVTIDSPDFTFRVAHRLRGAGVPLVHYVAPQVWAHRPGRAAHIATLFDHLMALLPFEPPLFERHGLACTFVGHPVVEEGVEAGDGDAFRRRHGLDPAAPLVCLLPGSRRAEVLRHLPVMRATVAALAAHRGPIATVVPTVPTVAETVAAMLAEWPVPPILVTDRAGKCDALAAADVAVAASGTVTLELALAGLPALVIYRTHPLTMWAARRLVRVRHIALANLVLDAPVLPEFLQEACRAETLAGGLTALLDDPALRARQRAGLAEAAHRVGLGGDAPSARAAAVVLDAITRGRRAAAA